MQHIDMEKFANGAFTEQINRELKKVTENIQDPNTDAKGSKNRFNNFPQREYDFEEYEKQLLMHGAGAEEK